MRRRIGVVVMTVALALFACADATADFCAVAGEVLPTLDGADSVARWRQIEASADDSVRADARALRVVAEQVARMGPDASFTEIAARIVRPTVAAHVQRVAAAHDAACRA